MASGIAVFSLGCNFDWGLIEKLIPLNEQYSSRACIAEVFGALPGSPVSSARPSTRIKDLGWQEFADQVKMLSDAGIAFNYVMNTSPLISYSLKKRICTYLEQLARIGVKRLTLGSTGLIRLVKKNFPFFHTTLSITYGACRVQHIKEAEAAEAEALYLDGTKVNRNFKLLRRLVRESNLELRLYANMSCIANCPVVKRHYEVFTGRHSKKTESINDAYFAGCSLVKLRNPVAWIQMPWIRPEDIQFYLLEGIRHYKLADRLADTKTLLQIAECYLRGVSPRDLSTIIERRGAKYRLFIHNSSEPLIKVLNEEIPSDFIEHFRSGECTSEDKTCAYCTELSKRAVRYSNQVERVSIPSHLKHLVPKRLLVRSMQCSGILN